MFAIFGGKAVYMATLLLKWCEGLGLSIPLLLYTSDSGYMYDRYVVAVHSDEELGIVCNAGSRICK